MSIAHGDEDSAAWEFCVAPGPRGWILLGRDPMRVISYFARVRTPKLVLWCYLAWYLAILPFYFDSSPVIWFSAIGISALIGIALIFATKVPGQAMDGWTKFRLFLFPFCVSSYSALIKGKGFILLFPTEMKPLLAGIGACMGVIVFQKLCMALASRGMLRPS